jgi:glyoxylase-like metal-dependent hydrolase (beta-lactamase superfamily II)
VARTAAGMHCVYREHRGEQSAYSLIHLEKNGSSEGWIETMKGIVALDADTFVPGHGDLQTKADLQKRLANAQER